MRKSAAKTPRYIEDVKVGDKLKTMVKGPMTVTGFIGFAQGWGGLYIRANKLAWKQLQKHPGLGIANKFGIPDVPERVHWEDDLATLVGTPAAYDYGPERCSWMTHHLTNWAGDSGFLRHIEVKIRRHNPVGDTLYIDGEVTRTSPRTARITPPSRKRRCNRTANSPFLQPAQSASLRARLNRLALKEVEYVVHLQDVSGKGNDIGGVPDEI